MFVYSFFTSFWLTMSQPDGCFLVSTSHSYAPHAYDSHSRLYPPRQVTLRHITSTGSASPSAESYRLLDRSNGTVDEEGPEERCHDFIYSATLRVHSSSPVAPASSDTYTSKSVAFHIIPAKSASKVYSRLELIS